MASAVLPSSAVSRPVSKSSALRFFPCVADLAFLLPVILLFVTLPGLSYLLNDGDTGWHIRTGEWILQHRAVPTVDLFSFTMPNAPWYAWEWAWEVVFASIHHGFGLAGVAVANLLVLCLVSALLYALINRVTSNQILSFVFTAAAMLGSAVHWLARPHLLSWLFILLFLHVLNRAEDGDSRVLWVLPLLTLLWANFHASFFVGIALILTTGLGAAVNLLKSKQVSCTILSRVLKPYLLCAAACLAASFVNPYTWHLHQHVYRYLNDQKLLSQIVEYQSLSFHGNLAICFEAMLLLGAAAALWCLQTGKAAGCLTILLWAHLALVAGRNIPVFLFVAVPWIACMVQDLLLRAQSVPCLRAAVKVLADVTAELAEFEKIRRIHLLPILTVGIIVWSFAGGKARSTAQLQADAFPERAMPLLASRSGRVFASDQWGDYLIYRLYPATRVFIDGRSDLYGADFVARYGQIMNGRYDCEQTLQQFAIETVVIKPSDPLATILKKSSHWEVLFDSGMAIVFGAQPKAPATGSSHQHYAKVSPVPPTGKKDRRVAETRRFVVRNQDLSFEERRKTG